MLKITPVGDKADLGAPAIYRGVELKIARMNNTRYKTAFRRVTRPYQKEIETNTLDDKTSDELYCQALAEGILVDWNKTTFPNKVEYTIDNAKDLLLNDTDCRDFVISFASDINNYLEEQEKLVTKES